MTFVWILNLGAERELEGRPLNARMKARLVEARRTVSASLLGPGDLELRDSDDKCAAEVSALNPAKHKLAARAFCPTPSAVHQFSELGLALDAPAVETLQKANSRAFSAAHTDLEGGRFFGAGSSVDDVLKRASESRVLLKANLSFAGSGQRRIDGAITAGDKAWIKRQLSASTGGVCAEPFLTLLREAGTPAFVSKSGEVTLGHPVEQWCEHGRWLRSKRMASEPITSTLKEAAWNIGHALSELGYFGPYNVDAHLSKERGWTTVSEVNARYSMGWAMGFSHVPLAERPDRQP